MRGHFFRDSHGEASPDDLVGEPFLFAVVFQREEDFGMSHGNSAVFEEGLCVRFQIEKSHGVRDRGPAFADAAGDFLLREAEFLVKSGIGGGLFNRVQALALEIFDEGEFQHLTVAGFANNDGDIRETNFFCSPPAALTGDEFIDSIRLTDDEGLDDAALADALDQLVQLIRGKIQARLKRAGGDACKREPLNSLAVFFNWSRTGHALVDECAEALAECLLCHGRGA